MITIGCRVTFTEDLLNDQAKLTEVGYGRSEKSFGTFASREMIRRRYESIGYLILSLHFKLNMIIRETCNYRNDEGNYV